MKSLQINPFGKPITPQPELTEQPIQPVDLNPPEPKYPPEIIDKAQRIYSSQYNKAGPEGKTPPIQPGSPAAISAAGRWGSGK